MTRLIDAEALKDTVMSKSDGMEDLWDTAGVLNMINNAPTVCVDLSEYSDKLWKEAYERGKNERSKGEWKEWFDERWGGTTIYCPYCHEDALENNKEGLYRQVKSNFCPNCGADMREAKNDTRELEK